MNKNAKKRFFLPDYLPRWMWYGLATSDVSKYWWIKNKYYWIYPQCAGWNIWFNIPFINLRGDAVIQFRPLRLCRKIPQWGIHFHIDPIDEWKANNIENLDVHQVGYRFGARLGWVFFINASSLKEIKIVKHFDFWENGDYEI